MQSKKISIKAVSSYLEKGGVIARVAKDYEERPSQVRLSEDIGKAFNEGRVALFEAGTGVGKSYAYLIPAVLWAKKFSERVIISTGTINLQAQLCDKDLPALQGFMKSGLKFMLLKGRQNYACIRKMQAVALDNTLFSGEISELDKILSFIKTHKTGDKAALPFLPSRNLWSAISSDSESCLGKRCPHYHECFVTKVKKEAEECNIVVVNHHLLFADIESRLNSHSYDSTSVLPAYKHIIFDEAHTIENAASSFFSESFNQYSIASEVNALYRKSKVGEGGHLPHIASLLKTAKSVKERLAPVPRLTHAVILAARKLDETVLNIEGFRHTLRLYESNKTLFTSFMEEAKLLKVAIDKLTSFIKELLQEVEEGEQDDPHLLDAKVQVKRLEATSALLSAFTKWEEERESVFWFEKKSLASSYRTLSKAPEAVNNSYVVYTKTPLDIAVLMNEGVYENMEAVVFTSATLKASGEDFSFFSRKIGAQLLPSSRMVTGEYKSPFPYKTNMLLAVIKDAPLPNAKEFQEFTERAVAKLIKIAGGRTLVLFTSYESLNKTYKAVSGPLTEEGISIMRQGEDSNERLLERFKKNVASVLLATDSFWQGVDIKGESLSQVIIAKLPFSVPDDPLFMAKADRIDKRGGSSFMELSVPDAVIKFRQGCGRLIRSKEDRGAVIVLDKRLCEKNYGRIFINSIPECHFLYEKLNEVERRVDRFLSA